MRQIYKAIHPLHCRLKTGAGDSKVEKAFWTVDEVSTYLSIKPSTIYQWAKVGGIPFFKIGKMMRFKKSEIDVWMEEHRGNGIIAKEKPRRAVKTNGKPKSEIDRIIKKAIDESKDLKYNPRLGSQVRSSTQKGGDHGLV